MATEPGESGICELDGKPAVAGGRSMEDHSPPKASGVLEFGYVTSARSRRSSWTSNPCDLFLAEQLLLRTSAADDEAAASAS